MITRIPIEYKLIILLAASFIAGCSGKTEFSSLGKADNGTLIYFVGDEDDGYGIRRATAGNVTDARSWIAVGSSTCQNEINNDFNSHVWSIPYYVGSIPTF